MRRELKLWIDGQEAEVLQDVQRISFTYSVDSAQPGGVGGSYAKRALVLPGTKANHKIYENIDQPPAVLGASNLLRPARAEVNGVPILAGKAQLSKARLRGAGLGFKAESYEVSFVGNNADWFQQIGSLLVRDLPWDNFTLSEANYLTQTDSDPLFSQGCFIAVKWRAWQVAGRVNYTELTPALFLRQILLKAFQSIGYKFESVFDDDPFRRLCIPVPLSVDGDYLKNFVNIRAARDVYTATKTGGYQEFPIVLTDDSSDPNFDGGGNYNTATGQYTAPLSALYSVRFSFIQPFSYDPDNDSINIMVNGSAVAGQFIVNAGIIELEYIGNLVAGDVVTLLWTAQDIGSPDVVRLEDLQLIIEAEKDTWQFGEQLEYKYIIPGTWLVKDFIKDITQIFNLAWETDVLSQTVLARPRDRFTVAYRAGGDGAATVSTSEGFYLKRPQKNLDGKIDLSRGGEMQLLSDRVQDYVLAWGTGDETTRSLELRTASSLYSARYRFPENRFPAGAEWLYTNIFAKTVHLNDGEISSGGFAVQIPLIYGKDYNKEPDADPDYTLNPKLLYFAGRRSGLDGYIRVYNPSTSATSALALPAAWQVNYNDPSAADWSLSFADEMTNYGGTVRGLFKSLHLHQARRWEEGRKYIVFANWNEGDISALSFRNAIEVNSDRFLLEKIDGYSPLTQGASRTELLLDVLPAAADAAKVSGPVLLEGATPGGLTTLGSIIGVIGNPAAAGAQVVRYRLQLLDHQVNTIDLAVSSGALALPDPYIAIVVNQNGKILFPELEWTISGLTITLDANTHFAGANYYITVHETL